MTPSSARGPDSSAWARSKLNEAFETLPTLSNFPRPDFPTRLDDYYQYFSSWNSFGAVGLQRWYQWLSVSWDTKLINVPTYEDLAAESSVPLPPSRFVYEELKGPFLTLLVCVICYWYNPTYSLLFTTIAVNLFYWVARAILFDQPRLTYDPTNPRTAAILHKCPLFFQPFRPTMWGYTAKIQTAMFALCPFPWWIFRSNVEYRRELVVLPDRGTRFTNVYTFRFNVHLYWMCIDLFICSPTCVLIYLFLSICFICWSF